MKKIIILLLAVFCLFSKTNIALAQNEEIYAKVEDTNVEFYSSPSDNSALFEVPYSYFVKTSSAVGNYFKATYKDVDGYVKKGSVKQMVGSPQSPYATATFKVFVSSYLYASPTKNSSVVSPIESTDIFSYYGKKSGEQLNSNSNIWYYCSLTKNGQTYHGYVFSGITDYLSTIPTNTEVFEEVNNTEKTSPSQEFVSLSKKTKIMLIISISIPSAMILYFLIKPSRIMQSSNKKRKAQRKVQHGDYYEFDENDL